MKRSDVAFAAVQIPLDYLALVASFLLSYWIRFQYPGFVPSFVAGSLADSLNYLPGARVLPYTHYLPYILGVSVAMTLIFVVTGLYRWQRFPRSAETFSQVTRSLGASFFVILLIAFARGTMPLPRLVIVYALVISFFLLLITRGIVAALRQLLQQWGISVVRIAILGDGDGAEHAREIIAHNRRQGYRVSGLFVQDEIKKLRRAIKARRCDEVLVAGHLNEQELVELREYCIEHRVGLLLVPSVMTFLSSKMTVRDVQGFPVIEIPVTPLEGWGWLVKRFFDIIVSAFFLVILSPIYVLLALIIYLDDPGPVFFRHQRLGEDLTPFSLIKFRTMKMAFCDKPGQGTQTLSASFQELLAKNPAMKKEWEAYHKLRDDPRVTRIGKWLRRLSLDELPQFLNVFQGDLSLVGPRPIVENELPRYGRLRYRLGTIKPGVTGLWQVSGRNDTTYEERVRLDMVYIESWSLWLDLTICFRTIGVLIFRRGAY